jgi:hypothetical protein
VRVDVNGAVVEYETVYSTTYEFGLVAFFHNVTLKASKAPFKLTVLTPRVNIASVERKGVMRRDLGIKRLRCSHQGPDTNVYKVG